MKYLVFDTNVIVQDFRLQGNSFNLFIRAYGFAVDEIFLPQVVLDEIVSQFRKKLNGEIEKSNVNAMKLGKYLGKEVHPLLDGEINEEVKKYKKYLLETLKKTRMSICEYPTVKSMDVAQRVMRRKKPFKSSGEGYCDYLIWVNIIEKLEKDADSEIIFITRNRKDFWEGSGLCQDLIDDLAEKNIDQNRIVLFETLKDFTEQKLIPNLDVLEKVKEQVNNDDVPSIKLTDWLEETLFRIIPENDAAFSLLGLSGDECGVSISEVYEILSYSVKEARALGNDDIYLLITTRAGVGIDVCADYYQYQESEAIQEIFRENNESVPLPHECIYTNGELELEVSVILNDLNFNNGSAELVKISGKGGFIEYSRPSAIPGRHGLTA